MMDVDNDKSVNIDEFNERFGFRVAHWDREQTMLQLIAKELIGTHKTPIEAFQAFHNNAMRRALNPMHFQNFKLYFDTVDDILSLRLKVRQDDGTVPHDDACSVCSHRCLLNSDFSLHGYNIITAPAATTPHFGPDGIIFLLPGN